MSAKEIKTKGKAQAKVEKVEKEEVEEVDEAEEGEVEVEVEVGKEKVAKSSTNKLNEATKLPFNVNAFKNSMRKMFKDHELSLTKLDKKTGETTISLPRTPANAYVAVTAVISQLATLVVTASKKSIGKDKTGRRTISDKILLAAILADDGMKELYSWDINTLFDAQQSYSDQVPIVNKEMQAFFMSLDKELSFTPTALTLLNFLLMRTYNKLVFNCVRLLRYATIATMTSKTVIATIEMLIPPSLGQSMITEVTRCVSLCNGVAVADGEEGEADEEAEEEAEEEEVDTKATKKAGKAATKPTTVKAAKPAAVKAAAKPATKPAAAAAKGKKPNVIEDEEDEEAGGEDEDVEEVEEVEEEVDTKAKSKPATKKASK